MDTPRRHSLLLALLALAALAGGALWLGLRSTGERPASAAVARDPARVPPRGAPSPAPDGRDALAVVPARPRGPLHPLEVALELVSPLGNLSAPGELPLGGGARARLRGSLNGAGGEPLHGSVRFVAGTNQGRVLEADAQGRIGAGDLYPGLQIVEIQAAGTQGALRELRLRNNAEEQLHIGFGNPASVHGRVLDTGGNPVPGAEVILDGQSTSSDLVGEFYFPRITSGHNVLALVRKQGFARLRQIVPIMAGDLVHVDRLTFTLERGCDLQVTLPERVGADTQAQVFLLPDAGARLERKFPWHEVNPTLVHAGGTFVIEDLPPGTVQVMVFHQGARSKAKVSSVHLVPERRETLVLHLEPAPRVVGRVTRGGKVVRGALVSLLAPDPAMAMVRALGQPLAYLEVDVLPLMPPGVQRSITGPSGEFVFSGYWDTASVRYLTAEGPDGDWAGVVVRAEEPPLELRLAPAPEPDGILSLRLAGEHSGLPVELVVDGVPREGFDLPPGQPLVVEHLPRGTWRLSVRWDSTWLAREQALVIDPQGSWNLTLPEVAQARR